MIRTLLLFAAVLQAIAVVYGVYLLSRRRGATGAWFWLLGAMLGMLVWRIVVTADAHPPEYFNPVIAIWGSTCMCVAMFLFGREVAARRRAEAERDALLQSERLARQDAERANRAKDSFLATLSHELRSPLAAILGWCTVMRRMGAQGDEHSRGLEVIERNARAQARLVDDILDVTRLQAGGLHIEIADVDVVAPVRAAVQAVRPAAEGKGLCLSLVAPDEALVVAGDAGRLQQIATNLLVNAVKFTPAGGSVAVALGRDGAYVELVVADTGEGIDPAFLPHVFARFRQGDESVSRRHDGVGLGLSIVQELVRLHGGEVRAASGGRGAGARFTVRLPLSEARPDVSPAERRGAGDPGTRALAGVRVVVIDDDADVRLAVARLVEQCGASVRSLESGACVQETLATFRPHVLLVDIGMPHEDGYMLLRRIRRLSPDRGGATPAISLTAHVRSEDRERALTAGFQDYLPKPVEVGRLVETIVALAVRDDVEGAAAANVG